MDLHVMNLVRLVLVPGSKYRKENANQLKLICFSHLVSVGGLVVEDPSTQPKIQISLI